MSNESVWRAINRAHWDEKVGIHLGPRGYDLTALREGRARFFPIEEAELGPVAGKRVLHLQCHIGSDTLKFAQRGANAVGLDFSPDAIAAARRLAHKLGLADRAHFSPISTLGQPANRAPTDEYDIEACRLRDGRWRGGRRSIIGAARQWLGFCQKWICISRQMLE